MSTIERTARKVVFDPTRTLVHGANQTGKSSLLKSIYWTLGAEPAVVHPNWRQAEVTCLLRLEVENAELSVLRHGNTFAVFNEKGSVVGSFTRVTSEMGPFLADMFDFKLTLPSRETSEATVPPPAFQFLPYYIDQDASWKHNWSGFTNLAQYSNWRRDVAEFHLGIRPNEYYVLKGERGALQRTIGEKELERKVLLAVLQRMRASFKAADFDIDVTVFQDEIARLVEACNELLQRENEYKAKYTELQNRRTELVEQIEFTKRAAADLQKDYGFATERISEGHVSCPVCGTQYQNSFAERFTIAADEDRLLLLIADLSSHVTDLDQQIASMRRAFRESGDELERIKAILASRQEAVTFAEVVRSEGKREADATLKAQQQDIDVSLGKDLVNMQELDAKIRGLTDKSRTGQITGAYRARMKQYLDLLNVPSLPESAYAKVDASIKETGSALPRALLAYYFSVLHTIRQFGDGTFFPVVVDSPNQQAQDKSSLSAMLAFIRDNQPKDSQVVLGLEDDLGIKIPGQKIELSNKYHLLGEREYTAVRDEITPLRNAMMNVRP